MSDVGEFRRWHSGGAENHRRTLEEYQRARAFVDTVVRPRNLHCVIREVVRSKAGRELLRWMIYDIGKLEAGIFQPTIKDGTSQFAHQSKLEGRREAGALVKEAVENALRSDLPMLETMAMERIHDKRLERELVDNLIKEQRDGSKQRGR